MGAQSGSKEVSLHIVFIRFRFCIEIIMIMIYNKNKGKEFWMCIGFSACIISRSLNTQAHGRCARIPKIQILFVFVLGF